MRSLRVELTPDQRNIMRYFTPILLAISLSGYALNAQALSATQTVEKETTVIAANGSVQTVREGVEKIIPGERIVYSLNFENDAAEAANDIVLTMPIPAEVKYIEGSAELPLANVTFSSDGGESFSNRQSVLIIDGAGNIRTASADELTHVRWTVAGPVNAGESGILSFAASVR